MPKKVRRYEHTANKGRCYAYGTVQMIPFPFF
jgi:hypothetical protein